MGIGLNDYIPPDDNALQERMDPFEIYGGGQELTAEEKTRAEAYLSDLKAMLSTPEGFRVMVVLLGRLHQFEAIYTGNSTTFYNCGKYEEGRRILMEVALADMGQYLLLQQEAVRRWARNSTAEPLKKR